DISDHDFLAYRDKLGTIAPQEMIAAKLPEAKLKNYAFHNNGDITFGNVSASWGLNFPSFSNGAACADLDGDGDVDIIINNINGEATILKNTLEESKPQGANYLDIQFADRDKESAGQGAWVALHYAGGKQQVYENTPYRGYLSSTQPGAHFGLGSVNMVDSVIIKWPGGRQQLLRNVKCNQKIKVQYANANQSYTWYGKSPKSKLFESLPDQPGTIIHSEDMFNDFAIQKLLPHKLSDYAPGLAAGDVNGDGLDDIIMGGSPGHSAEILLQQPGGNFIEKKLLPNAAKTNKQQDDTGLLLFDADSDGDMDLYIASGGCSSIANNPAYNDRLFINDGKGNFVYDSLALPVNNASKACVRAVDFDKNGDLDLFVAGRVVPGKYPQPASCFIYRNDSKNRNALFTDITSQAAAGLKDAGMVTDAVWTDFDNDGWVDLVIAGEFMPVEFFKNINGKLQKISTGLDSQTGWWNSIIPGDFDNDGDIDYIIGNTGTNTLYTRASEYPVKIYAKDFDNNGIVDGIITMYSPSSTEDTTVREFPVPARDELTRQVADFRKRFPTYKSYATATIDSLFTPAQFKGVQKLVANNFKSCYVRNDGGGKFTIMPLPIQAQMSALFGMLAEDVNDDGNLDVIISSNDFGTDLNTGQADAMNGLVLLGDGNGKFTAISAAQSGVFIPGSGRALVKIADKDGHCIVAASQNNGPLKFFIQNNAVTTLRVNAADEVALEKLKNGKTRRVEINYGAGFLSQSARFLNISSQVISVEIIDNRGRKRKVL
ncbi:MAG TPA: VCBS repeat-containing protein, partial [Chitinophagaceae bacterium]|nr:VCBS repeat-containing protein [Chitinophagaceae bacterium]